jgi:hypothetical protein
VPVLKHLDKQLQRARLEVYEDDYEMEEYSLLKHGPFLNAIRDSAEFYRRDQVTSIARLRGLNLINALIRNNVAPEDFEARDDKQEFLISIGVPQRMTVDTCTGQTMPVKFVDGRWRAYSVGLDTIDNGGDISADSGLTWQTEEGLNVQE